MPQGHEIISTSTIIYKNATSPGFTTIEIEHAAIFRSFSYH